MSKLIQKPNGIGHSTMMHTMRELKRLAKSTHAAVLVTTLTVHVSAREESPSILTASQAKPGLGTSWHYATDMQVLISRLDTTNPPTADSHNNEDQSSRTDKRQKRQRISHQEEDDMAQSAGEAAAANGEASTTSTQVRDSTDYHSSVTRFAEISRSKHMKAGEWCLFNL
ncbi:hypothetical protein DFQ26_008191 [Actinomortierella ambigua]|nr:hypothetical protein DFQ26_008191 [Actinomortierella ambigua]